MGWYGKLQRDCYGGIWYVVLSVFVWWVGAALGGCLCCHWKHEDLCIFTIYDLIVIIVTYPGQISSR